MSASSIEVQSVEGVKVGDFFVSSWGYDQTNVDFYKVVGLTAKRIKVQQWSTKVEDDGFHAKVVPGDKPIKGGRNKDGFMDATVEAPVETKTVHVFSDTPRFKVNSYAGARLWDGRPAYQTGSQAGR
jgi:hypothetical protein